MTEIKLGPGRLLVAPWTDDQPPADDDFTEIEGVGEMIVWNSVICFCN